MESIAVYNYIKKHKKQILTILLFPFIMAILALGIEILFNTGTIIGTYIRMLADGICI